MQKLMLTVVFILGVTCCWAQQPISGIIRNQEGKPLEGATVEIAGLRGGFTAADPFGSFHFQAVPEGRYTMRVRHLGYFTFDTTFSVPATGPLKIFLTEDIALTEEVVITATRAGENTPATYTNLSKERIRKQNFGQDMPYLLNWTPSVVSTSDAGAGVGYTGIRIRGSDATRINVTINGVPYNDSESLGTFWVNISDIASSTQNVQIQRGVGTSTNGAGAFGATINLQTLSHDTEPYARLVNSFGSFGTRRHTLNFGSGKINDRWAFDGRVSAIKSDGFIDRGSSDLSSYYFSGGYFSDRTLIKAIVFGGKERTYQSWYGVPESRLNNDEEAMLVTAANEGWNEEQTQNLLSSNSRTFNPYLYENQVDDYTQDHYQLHLSQRFGEAVTANLAFHYTDGRGFYEEYRYDNDFEDYGLGPVIIGDSVISSSDLIRRRWLDNDFYGVTYSLNWQNRSWELVAGGGWNRYEGDHFGELVWAQVTTVPHLHRYYFNQGDKRDFNSFVRVHYKLSDKFNAFADLQYRRLDYKLNGLENDQFPIDFQTKYNFFNPKAGLTYRVNPTDQVYASFSVANREPVRSDFIDNLANPPKHERLNNLEVGFRRFHDKYTLNANYYFMDYKDELVLTGKVNDVGAAIHTNVDASYRMGIELEGMFRFSKQWSWNANMTLSRNKIKNYTEVLYDEFSEITRQYNDIDISFSPAVVAGSGLTFAPHPHTELTLLTKYVGRQYLDNTANPNRSLDPYLVNDLRLSYAWQPSFIKEINVSFLVNNVFDELYESNGYTWGYVGGGTEYRETYYYPQAGRNFMVMIAADF